MSRVETGAGWTMHLGDCLDVLPTLERVDHVITDPPYEANAHADHRRSAKGGDARVHGVVTSPIPFAAITDEVRRGVGGLFARLVARWALVFCQSEGLAAWQGALAPMRHVRSCVWIKPDSSPQFSGDRPAAGFEFIEVAHSAAAMKWNGGGRRGVFTHGSKDPANRPDHPTPKPLPLMLELVALFTDPGETILDPFAGSGTTGVACLRLGRRFVGVEKSPEYFALAVERLRAEESGSSLSARRAGQVPLFGGGR